MSKREIRLNVWAMIWMAPLALCLAIPHAEAVVDAGAPVPDHD